jgi:hypothetical protein
MRRSDSLAPFSRDSVPFAASYRHPRRRKGLPSSWETRVGVPPLLDPGVARGRPSVQCRPGVAFRQHDGVGPHDELLSGLNHAAHQLPVYASHFGLLRGGNTRFRLWTVLTGWDCLPTGFRCEVSTPFRSSISSSPKLRLAHRARNRNRYIYFCRLTFRAPKFGDKSSSITCTSIE